jgi:hypothetical protein
MKKIIRLLLVAAVSMAMVALVAGPVLAAAAKFKSATSSVNSSGALVVAFDESGLGNGNIDYTLEADATATYACLNGGGKNPSAANKRTFNDEVSGSGSFESKNGRVQASLSAGPISAGSFSCPSGQRLVLASVTYTNIVLTDTTNGTVKDDIADASRTFFNV